MKEIEDKINEWKANRDMHAKSGSREAYKYADGVVDGLLLARAVINLPPNTQMQIDARPDCVLCKNYRGRLYKYNYCGNCGKALHD